MANRLILGITGYPGAGKSEAGNYLAKHHGFHIFDGGKYLKQEAAKEDVALQERQDYNDSYTKLRRERTASFIADLTLEMPGRRVANIGLRKEADARKLLSAGGLIVAIYCPLGLRHMRTQMNDGEIDPKYPQTLGEFHAVEKMEEESSDPGGTDIGWIFEQAKLHINNSGSIADLHRNLDIVVGLARLESR